MLSVSQETSLDCYEALLRAWNGTLNLVGKGDERRLRARHIDDCLQLAPLIPAGVNRGIDLGSGAGLPGLVLAIATGIAFDLLESDLRKVAFLTEAARVTRAPVRILAGRIEAVRVPPAALVVARALAPLPRLLGYAYPLLASDGSCLFLKGARAADELTDAARLWQMNVSRHPSATDPAGCILRIGDLRPRVSR